MENIDRIINTGLKLILIILLAFVIYQQGKVINMVWAEKEKLDADPLAYGAQVYGIKECMCFISANKSISFNPSGSKWIIHQEVQKFTFNLTFEVLNGTGRNT